MSIAPYTSFEVTDLSSNKQPYVNCTTEFGYFGNIGVATADRCNSMPTFLLTNNGIATVDASGLSILNPGIYTLNVAIDCSAANITTGGDFSMQFNFGTTRLFNVLIGGIIDSFGQTKGFGMYSFGDTATTYPGIISWITDDGTSGSFPTPSNYVVLGGGYLWYVYNTNCNTNRSFKSGILTTKITFIINEPTTIYFNTFCSLALTMGTSYFTLKAVSINPIFNWTRFTWSTTSGGPASVSIIASTSQGNKVFAVAPSPTNSTYSSSNYGANWSIISTTSGVAWRSIASDSAGVNLVAGTTNGTIYWSNNSGTTWNISTGAPTGVWSSIASSSTGQFVVAVSSSTTGTSGIYRSTNYGQTWSVSFNSSRFFISIASSKTGQHLVAGENNGSIHTSNDFGSNWTLRSVPDPATGKWYVACTETGQIMFAIANSGNLYRSNTFGFVWVLSKTSASPWTCITTSSSGKYLAVGTSTGVMATSSDYSDTLVISNAPVQPWFSLASSASGQYLFAGPNNTTGIIRGVYNF